MPFGIFGIIKVLFGFNVFCLSCPGKRRRSCTFFKISLRTMKVKFLPQGISVPADSDKSVMELARENQLSISSSCNGMCSCAECRVYVVEGEAHVLPPSVRETELIGGAHFVDNRRLSCQLFCFGDVTVDLSEQVERKKQGGRKQLPMSKDRENIVLGDVLVEQDQDMAQVSAEEEKNLPDKTKAGFYQKKRGENRQTGRGGGSFSFRGHRGRRRQRNQNISYNRGRSHPIQDKKRGTT